MFFLAGESFYSLSRKSNVARVSLLSHNFNTNLETVTSIEPSEVILKKKDETHFQAKLVIEQDIFTDCTDYRDRAADVENL